MSYASRVSLEYFRREEQVFSVRPHDTSIVSKECTFTKTAVAREWVDAILLQCGCGIYAYPFDWVILPRQVEVSRFPPIVNEADSNG